jgi:hypothetical protein
LELLALCADWNGLTAGEFDGKVDDAIVPNMLVFPEEDVAVLLKGFAVEGLEFKLEVAPNTLDG